MNKKSVLFNISKIILSTSLVLTLCACSPRVHPGSISNSGIAGISLGGLAGGLIGNNIGAEQNQKELGALIGAGTGVLGGLIAGEFAEAKRLEHIRENSPPKRIPVYEDSYDRSREINNLRYEQEKASKLGAGETKSWEERYLDSEEGFPYQGQ